MTTSQAERPQVDATDVSQSASPRRGSRGVAALVAIVVLVASGATAGIVLSRHHAPAAHQAVVLGHALQPLPIYRRIQIGGNGATATPRTRSWPFSEIAGPGHTAVTPAKPLLSLHVQYADVRLVLHSWNIELVAPEGRTFNIAVAHGRSFVAVVDGRALEMLFVQGSDDGTNFAIGAGPNVLTRDQAITIAQSLTTRVTVSPPA
jgi:hypothetical protein